MSRLLRQTTTGDLYVWSPFLAERSDMEPYVSNYPDKADATYKEVLPRFDSEVVRFRLSANGIGDAVCGMYAACGVSETGRQVQFHTKHYQFLKTVSHPGVMVLEDDKTVFDANANYRQQLRDAQAKRLTSRPHHYISNLKVSFGVHECDPCRPKQIAVPAGDDVGVVLAPISTHPSRDWWHWRRLAILLKDLPLVAIGTESQRPAMATMFHGLPVQIRAGLEIDELLSLVGNARVLVGNDSGMVHLGGLLGTTCVCVVAQFDPAFLFYGSPTVHGIESYASCGGFGTVDGAGWDPDCLRLCSALQTISPDRVAKKVRELL